MQLRASVTESCADGACGASAPGSPGTAYLKAPQFVTSINGPLHPDEYAPVKPFHVSTFGGGKWLGTCTAVSDPKNCTPAGYKCDWVPDLLTTPAGATAKCIENVRTRVRVDYDIANTRGACDEQWGECFNMVAKALPHSGGPDPQPVGTPGPWESADPKGLDYWRRLADARPSPSGDDGCDLAGQDNVTSLVHEQSSNWEYGGYTDDYGRLGYDGNPDPNIVDMGYVAIGFKAWDGCQNYYDAPAFFRRFGTITRSACSCPSR